MGAWQGRPWPRRSRAGELWAEGCPLGTTRCPASQDLGRRAATLFASPASPSPAHHHTVPSPGSPFPATTPPRGTRQGLTGLRVTVAVGTVTCHPFPPLLKKCNPRDRVWGRWVLSLEELEARRWAQAPWWPLVPPRTAGARCRTQPPGWHLHVPASGDDRFYSRRTGAGSEQTPDNPGSVSPDLFSSRLASRPFLSAYNKQ